MREVECPVCQAIILLDEEDKKGDAVYCSYCGSPLKLTAKEDDEKLMAEEEN